MACRMPLLWLFMIAARTTDRLDGCGGAQNPAALQKAARTAGESVTRSRCRGSRLHARQCGAGGCAAVCGGCRADGRSCDQDPATVICSMPHPMHGSVLTVARSADAHAMQCQPTLRLRVGCCRYRHCRTVRFGHFDSKQRWAAEQERFPHRVLTCRPSLTGYLYCAVCQRKSIDRYCAV
jgi:hypothetical protein